MALIFLNLWCYLTCKVVSIKPKFFFFVSHFIYIFAVLMKELLTKTNKKSYEKASCYHINPTNALGRCRIN